MNDARVAYFSMEIALDPAMPTYSGGLGILAGDTVRSAADLKVPMTAVTLLHRKGYFLQKLDAAGWQTETNPAWPVERFLRQLSQRATVQIEGRAVVVRVWVYEVQGVSGATVPVYLLDTDVSENSAWDRTLTDFLYGGDDYYRLCQEIVLGIGGVRILEALGYRNLERYHMNEGHAALLALELLDRQARAGRRAVFDHDDVAEVRRHCVFTTHTPVPAGHDKFPLDVVERVLGRSDIFGMHEVFINEGVLNMTHLALNVSHYINGVAKKHGEVSRAMFMPTKDSPHYAIDWITNGVHAATWTAAPLRALYDRFIPGWREDNASLRYALKIPTAELRLAHRAAKEQLLQRVNDSAHGRMRADVLTLGCARRAATYKRTDLIFHDIERLRRMTAGETPIQMVFAGKAHPYDQGGKELIHRMFGAIEALRGSIEIVYLENYDMRLAGLLTAGVDVWLNTPQPPLEASGTSGMKAALNGVPSLSILDGWWIEGCLEGVTGWAIGDLAASGGSEPEEFARDACALYDKLEGTILPLFYGDPEGFAGVMLQAAAINGSFFNTQRMVNQYVLRAYFE